MCSQITMTIPFAVLVELNNLWKIKAAVGTVEGFNAQAFDELIQVCLKCLYHL